MLRLVLLGALLGFTLGNSSFIGIPTPIWLTIITFAVFAFLLNYLFIYLFIYLFACLFRGIADEIEEQQYPRSKMSPFLPFPFLLFLLFYSPLPSLPSPPCRHDGQETSVGRQRHTYSTSLLQFHFSWGGARRGRPNDQSAAAINQKTDNPSHPSCACDFGPRPARLFGCAAPTRPWRPVHLHTE